MKDETERVSIIVEPDADMEFARVLEEARRLKRCIPGQGIHYTAEHEPVCQCGLLERPHTYQERHEPLA